MFSALHKKYDAEITKYWDSQVPTYLSLITTSDLPAYCVPLTYPRRPAPTCSPTHPLTAGEVTTPLTQQITVPTYYLPFTTCYLPSTVSDDTTYW